MSSISVRRMCRPWIEVTLTDDEDNSRSFMVARRRYYVIGPMWICRTQDMVSADLHYLVQRLWGRFLEGL